MSYVEIYAFDKDGNSHEYGEARNSHGGAVNCAKERRGK